MIQIQVTDDTGLFTYLFNLEMKVCKLTDTDMQPGVTQLIVNDMIQEYAIMFCFFYRYVTIVGMFLTSVKAKKSHKTSENTESHRMQK